MILDIIINEFIMAAMNNSYWTFKNIFQDHVFE